MKNTLYWVWLSLVLGPGSTAAVRLIRHFGDAGTVYRASDAEFSGDCPVKDRRILTKLAAKSLSEAERIIRWCESMGITVLCPEDDEYPKSLLQLRDAPMVLYVAGKLPPLTEHLAIAVVGTRKMSDYGRDAAYSIGSGLASGGAVLVSGMALGIDGMAMAGALDAGGCAVGVLGCGIDIVYPKEHKELMLKTLKNGAVVTEYPPGTEPCGAHFPVRNRIISGLCQGTVVVEADGRSGALITARQAVYQGRDLYAVPGRVGDSGADGTNRLIKDGARAVTSAVDILQNYEFIYPNTVSVSSAMTAMAHSGAEGAAAGTVARRSIKKRQSRNYYGSGTYGGKAPEVNKNSQSKECPAADAADAKKMTAAKAKDRSKSEEKILFGSSSSESKHIDLDMLGADEIRVYNIMKPDVPTLPDEIAKKGVPIAVVMAALTLLEISGAVEAGAGGYFMRSSADIDLVPEIQS